MELADEMEKIGARKEQVAEMLNSDVVTPAITGNLTDALRMTASFMATSAFNAKVLFKTALDGTFFKGFGVSLMGGAICQNVWIALMRFMPAPIQTGIQSVASPILWALGRGVEAIAKAGA